MTANTVLQMLENQIAGGPPPVVLPEFFEIEYTVPEMRTWAAYVTPFGGIPTRIEVRVASHVEAHRLARKQAFKMFPRRSFTTQVRQA